jgi:bis(5'-nucleosyl)-tetraphosphatase (symmetrical)
VRFCDARGRRPARDDPPPPPPFLPWFEQPRAWDPGGRTIVFGHWAQRGLVLAPGLRGLDTGCVWGGRLTAWIAEEDRCVDVPAQRAWAAIGD